MASKGMERELLGHWIIDVEYMRGSSSTMMKKPWKYEAGSMKRMDKPCSSVGDLMLLVSSPRYDVNHFF
ncbi:hypothetical protein C5167_044372 [Papaver somniferum]|uniref:Uncharacterized protein n=1 Tax=Papaver somniferum TaxID=3469 RepID=A0A4Y7L9X5_PAPSO|nr:hypothetical protein C5167_044372 [Papaver somniferum]